MRARNRITWWRRASAAATAARCKIAQSHNRPRAKRVQKASQDSKHSSASAQIICKQTTITEHGKDSLHCQPFDIFCKLWKKINPHQVEPARSDRSLCQKKSKKDPCVFEGNTIEKGHLRIGSLNEEHDTFSWFVHLEVR